MTDGPDPIPLRILTVGDKGPAGHIVRPPVRSLNNSHCIIGLTKNLFLACCRVFLITGDMGGSYQDMIPLWQYSIKNSPSLNARIFERFWVFSGNVKMPG